MPRMVTPAPRPSRPSTPPGPPAAGTAPLEGPLVQRPTQLLRYEPSGLLGGTFTCTSCGAQGWQPDLLVHGAGCPYGPRPASVQGAA